jgi:hypothetical protein
MENQEKLATQGTQDGKKIKHVKQTPLKISITILYSSINNKSF